MNKKSKKNPKKPTLPKAEYPWVFHKAAKNCGFCLPGEIGPILLMFKSRDVALTAAEHIRNIAGYKLRRLLPEEYNAWIKECWTADHAERVQFVDRIERLPEYDDKTRLYFHGPYIDRPGKPSDKQPATDGQHRHSGPALPR